jgi:hypothetical protein
MLMLAPWSVVGAMKLAAAKDIGNSPSRHCDASSPDASRNGFSVAQGAIGHASRTGRLGVALPEKEGSLDDYPTFG